MSHDPTTYGPTLYRRLVENCGWTPEEARAGVRRWLALPATVRLDPGNRGPHFAARTVNRSAMVAMEG